MIKIILSIIAVLLIFFFIVTSFASGFVRGLKLMSIRNIKQSPLEEKLLKQFFKQNQDVDPFFYSLYMKDVIKENTDVIKKTIQSEITGKWMNKRSKKIWVVDESKLYDGFVVVVNNKISRSFAKKSFLKNWKKI
tara:strand:- start:1678 stop:2082 length:405 start_codon:yes stop_codon:yes gene_type:complete